MPVLTLALVIALAPPPAAPSLVAPSDAQCAARKAAKVALAVDAKAMPALTAMVLAHLTEQCLSPIAVSTRKDDVAAAAARGARVLVRLGATMTAKYGGAIDGINVTIYDGRITARLLRVADRAVIGDVDAFNENLVGVKGDRALNGVKAPMTDAAAAQILAALDRELGVADEAPAACKPTSVQLVESTKPTEGAELLRGVFLERLAARCITIVDHTAGEDLLRLDLTFIPADAKRLNDAKPGKYTWVVIAALKRPKGDAREPPPIKSATMRPTMATDSAHAAKQLVERGEGLEGLDALADQVAAAVVAK